jgi:hypothetical protein
MNRKSLVRFWSIAVGGMDAVTGLLLVFVPGFVISLLRIPAPSGDGLVFLSWVGVFVAGVGFSYGFALRGGKEAATVWKFTAMIRLFVGTFLIWKIASGELVPAWIVVAISDAFVGLVQIFAIRIGFLKEAEK